MEPYETHLKVESSIISFFLYYNDALDVFEELNEFDLDLFGLKERGWREFSVRPVSPTGVIAQNYGFGLLFESINQNCIDLFNNCDNLENLMHC